VKLTPFGPYFPDQVTLDDAFDSIRFPGLGSFLANQLGAKLDPVLEFMYVELPQQGSNRYLAVERLANGSFKVLADFVGPAVPEPVRVRRASNGRLEFLSKDGAVVRSTDAA
jgi:hypothetical protein